MNSVPHLDLVRFTTDIFSPSVYVGVEAADLQAKINALTCYRKVMREVPHPRSREGLSAVATYRGGQAGYRYAEAFQLIFQRGIGSPCS